MPNFNKVFLMGNLTRDPEIRYTPSGTALTKFGLAVSRSFKSKDGQQHDDTCFVDITAFGRQAEVISEYCSKGQPLFVEGRLEFSQWEDQSGQRRSKLAVVLESFQFLGSRRDQDGAPPQRPASAQQAPPPQAAQPQAPPAAEPDFSPNDEPPPSDDFDIEDEKIPF